jgi:thioredoxin reductase (NADPH)
MNEHTGGASQFGELYDCAVVGGGPAGLSAALYLGRMRRRVVVIDDSEGRSTWHQVNRNYLGFVNGIHASKLREIGRVQCEKYGVYFVGGRAESVRMEGEDAERRFYLGTTGANVVARTLILATGVDDHFPEFEGSEECIGRSMFWCIICDGYETMGKRIVVLGHGDRAASLALQLLVFTPHVTLVSWDEPFSIEPHRMKWLAEHGVACYDAKCVDFRCAPGEGQLHSVALDDGTVLELDSLFVAQHMEPNTQLAKQLGIKLDEHGFVMTDVEQCTNVDGVYAAGDLSKINNHQVSSAVHEGGMAAAAANYYLYEDWQKE